MSDKAALPEHSPDPGPTSSHALAETPLVYERRSRWPGWVWVIPIAALAVVAWLIVDQLSSGGPQVTIVFPQSGGIGVGADVQYQGMKVGAVTKVKLEKDLQHVRVQVRMDPEMAGHLGPGTEFWIAGPSLSDLSSIRSIISGPALGILPQTGKVQSTFAGLMEAPAIEDALPGRRFVLSAKELGSLSMGSPIYFRDLKVGKVVSTGLQPDQSFRAAIFIKQPYDALVRDGTRFWNAGAVQLSFGGAGPRLELQSLASLVQGAIAFETPEVAQHGPAASDGRGFTLYGSKDAAEYAPGRDAVRYQVVFGIDDGGLADGAAVRLAGRQIGSVVTTTLRVNHDSGALEQHATLAIEPWRLGLETGDPGTAMNALMQKLIARGLRAQVGSSVPVIGAPDVELTFVHDAPAATLTAGNPPELPTAPGGAGLQGAMVALNTIANKVNGVPLDQIADNLRVATAKLSDLVASPRLADSIDALNRSLDNVERVTASARSELPETLNALRRVATEAEGTVAGARQLIASTSGEGTMGLNSAGLGQTLFEVSRAAQAIRELAEFLTRNPSALIKGRE
ncbi:MAG TPA: MlaD family protein [Acetobacteraceae bacterium]|nr:MlaD family protein [Acetobacteraceae bacterium]